MKIDANPNLTDKNYHVAHAAGTNLLVNTE